MATVERDNPRISINQLSQYLVASPLQRRRIIEKQKRPQTFLVNWYEFAKGVMEQFIVKGCAEERIIINEIDRLYAEMPSDGYQETRFRTNAEALTVFLDSYDELIFDDLKIVAGESSQPQLNLSGVDVSVRPEFLLSGVYRGDPSVGALKLYFSKDQPLDGRTAPYIAAVVHRYATEFLAGAGGGARPRHSIVLDVFAGVVYTAPAAYTRRFKELDAACQEIALLWPTV